MKRNKSQLVQMLFLQKLLNNKHTRRILLFLIHEYKGFSKLQRASSSLNSSPSRIRFSSKSCGLSVTFFFFDGVGNAEQ